MLSPLRATLEPVGLNLIGVVDPAAWDAEMPPHRKVAALFPATQAIVVIGNGGGTLWERFVADLAQNPAHLTGEAHPLDAFVRREVMKADAELSDIPRRWFWAAAETDLHIDFRIAAHLAGLGGRSRMGLLLHPQHGLWLGLRAACFLAAPLPFSAPGGPDLCDGCPAPCISACPGEALASGSWDVNRCSQFNLSTDRCFATCHARLACPVGTPYSEEEVHYHYDRASGRERLREKLGIPAEQDHFRGEGPHWGGWRQRVRVA